MSKRPPSVFKMPCVCGVMLASAFGFQSPASGQAYLITDLSNPNDSYRMAHGINAAGQVVGEYGATNLVDIGAFWHNHGTNTDLGVLVGFLNAYARGMNTNGQIVGWCDMLTGVERAFIYSNGVMTKLETLAMPPTLFGYSEAHAVNRSGQVVGTATLTDTTVNHAVLWSGATKKDLGALGGPSYNSSAFGINNSGVVVGETEVVGSIFVHAFSYSNNVMADLGTLPGGGYSRATAINDSGVVAGESEALIDAGFQIRAFVCAQGPGSMQDLGTLGGTESSAKAINSAGHIVGYALDSNNVSRAFLYDGSKMLDLNTMIPPGSGWTNLEAATGINDAGQICGYGQFADGLYRAFLLTRAGPLTVAITNPTHNASFPAPATFVVSASATDTAGTVTNVAFLVNGTVIGNAKVAPYSVTVSNLSAGVYNLAAVASDNGGLKATNSIGVTVTGSAGAVTLMNEVLAGNNFSFSFATQAGRIYAGQFATQLPPDGAWLTFTNLAGDGSTVRVTDTTATNSARYYRVSAQ